MLIILIGQVAIWGAVCDATVQQVGLVVLPVHYSNHFYSQLFVMWRHVIYCRYGKCPSIKKIMEYHSIHI